MKSIQWGALIGMLLLLSIAWGETKEKPQFYLGATREVTLMTLGVPTARSTPDADGKELWYYNRAVVTFLKGKVVSWRNFNEVTPTRPVDARPLMLGSTQEEAAAQLGFPPTALRYTGLVIGRKPIGEEEWTYSTGTLIFLDGLVVGWRNVTTPLISLGEQATAPKRPELGAPAQDLIAGLGSPPALTCYVKSGDQLWSYPQEMFLLRDGKIIWRGVPQPRTPAEQPPVLVEKPNETNPGEAPPQEDKGFINDPEFSAFRQGYEPVLQRILNANPRFVDSPGYRAMRDCLNQRPWWAIIAQANIDRDYAGGVDAIEKAYNQYLNEQGRR